MADLKISSLPASTTPLAGTEVLPIVQSGATKKVSVANLTAGRAVGATSIQFGSGSVLSSYETGSWTPTDASGSALAITVTQAGYTKVGNMVTAQFYITYPTNASVGGATITLPFVPSNIFQAGAILYTNSIVRLGAVNTGGGGSLFFYDASTNPVANATLSGKFIICNFTYLT